MISEKVVEYQFFTEEECKYLNNLGKADIYYLGLDTLLGYELEGLQLQKEAIFETDEIKADISRELIKENEKKTKVIESLIQKYKENSDKFQTWVDNATDEIYSVFDEE